MDFRKNQKLWREKSQYADKLESRLHARSGLTENSNYLKHTGRSNVAATGAYTYKQLPTVCRACMCMRSIRTYVSIVCVVYIHPEPASKNSAEGFAL